MTTVWEVASEAEKDDRITWLGTDADVDKPEASTVTPVRHEDGMMTVKADGPRGADVSLWVNEDGSSNVLHEAADRDL